METENADYYNFKRQKTTLYLHAQYWLNNSALY